MDIKTFVSESLDQIIRGVEHAQSQNEASSINSTFGKSFVTERQIDVEFDIAVTLESGSESKGGIAVFGGAVNLGTQGKSNKSDITVSRIKFSVPIAFRLKQSRPQEIS
jgi:hypothetical protein